jgi:hypothetical protein
VTTKIFQDRTQRFEGPHRLTQERPRNSVWAARSIAVVEPAKNQLLQDFRRRSIFDFCNTIRQNRPLRRSVIEEAIFACAPMNKPGGSQHHASDPGARAETMEASELAIFK